MMKTLPTLVLSAEDADGFFYLDGHLASRAGSAVRIPAPAYGEHCLQFFPLGAHHFPVTLGIDFSGGLLRTSPKNAAQVVHWPENVWEICVLPWRQPVLSSPFPRVLDSCTLPWDGGMNATLFWENALYVAIENEQGALLLGERLCDNCTDGRLRLIPRCDASDLLLVHNDQAPGICAVIRFEDKPELYFCETADSCTLETEDSPLLVCLRDLKDPAGHQLKTSITLDRALEVRRETGFFTGAPTPPENEQELVCMFLGAVKLKLEEEAATYLTPSLRESYPFSVLQEYLGDFSDFSIPPYTLQADDDRPLVGLLADQDEETRARIFEFEVLAVMQENTEKNLINNIKEKCSWFE